MMKVITGSNKLNLLEKFMLLNLNGYLFKDLAVEKRVTISIIP